MVFFPNETGRRTRIVARLFRTLRLWLPSDHRRRIKTEERAKVVVAVWGAEFIEFFAALAILHLGNFTKKKIIEYFLYIILVQFILFFKLFFCKIASPARNWINSVPQTAATTFALSFFFILLLCFRQGRKQLLVQFGGVAIVVQTTSCTSPSLRQSYKK